MVGAKRHVAYLLIVITLCPGHLDVPRHFMFLPWDQCFDKVFVTVIWQGFCLLFYSTVFVAHIPDAGARRSRPVPYRAKSGSVPAVPTDTYLMVSENPQAHFYNGCNLYFLVFFSSSWQHSISWASFWSGTRKNWSWSTTTPSLTLPVSVSNVFRKILFLSFWMVIVKSYDIMSIPYHFHPQKKTENWKVFSKKIFQKKNLYNFSPSLQFSTAPPAFPFASMSASIDSSSSCLVPTKKAQGLFPNLTGPGTTFCVVSKFW